MRADRLLSILMLLQSRGRLSARQLAAELEVCERTIYRDMLALSTAGVPVVGQAGPEGGFELLDRYRTDLTGLTAGEARALFMLNLPGPLTRLGLAPELKTAMLKLTAALPAARRQDEERVRQRFYLDPGGWDQAHEPQPFLQIIQQAVWEERQLIIRYSPIFDVQIERQVQPYGLAARAGEWYLVFARAGRMRVRRVADLLDVRLCAETFERQPGFDLPAFWQVWYAEEQQFTSAYPVTLRVTPKALPDLARRLGPALPALWQQAAPAPDGSRVLTLHFRWINEAIERLLPFGSAVEVLEPFALRASLADLAGQMARLYQGPVSDQDK